MTTSTDVYSEVLFNDGEGVTHDDLNNIQRNINSKIWDQIVHGAIGAVSNTGLDPEFGAQDGTQHPLTRCYCPFPGEAYLRQGSANHKIQIARGTLLQKILGTPGSDQRLLSYSFDGTQEWTLTNGDATNPRVDLLQMKLSLIEDTPFSRDFEDATTRIVTTTTPNKKRRVQADLTVKVGTPAVSPTIPEPDTGYVVVGTVVVGNGWTTGGNAPIFGIDTAALNNAVVHDQRMPVCVRAFTVDANQIWNAGTWVLNATDQSSISGAPGTGSIYAPYKGPLGRLVAIGIHKISGTFPGTDTTQLGYIPGAAAAQTSQFTARNTLTLGATSNQNEIINFLTFEAAHAAAAGPTISQSATTKIGIPIWSNGCRSPREVNRLSLSTALERLVYKHTRGVSGTDVLGAITFYMAIGL